MVVFLEELLYALSGLQIMSLRKIQTKSFDGNV